jgi:hypothetical protein
MHIRICITWRFSDGVRFCGGTYFLGVRFLAGTEIFTPSPDWPHSPHNLNLGCLHPVACVRSGDGGFCIRLRNVTIVGYPLSVE